MALSIKNDEVERLAASVAALTGESKTEAVRRALLDRKERLARALNTGRREVRFRRFLEQEIWPLVPQDERGRRLSREQKEALLGYGDAGV